MAVAIPAAAHADAVLAWNAHAAQAIVTTGGQSPPRAFIRLAMVHLAIYDAVNAIEGKPFRSFASTPLVNRPASPDAAVAAAAHDVLVALFPAQAPDLDAKYNAALATLPADTARANGIAVGQQAAAAILAARANDGRDGTATYIPGSGPGVWIPTPPAFLGGLSPETPLVQPFGLESGSQFRPEAPPDLGSRVWVRDYNQVKALGALVGSTRTPEQTDIGRFWTDNPPLQWNRAWRALSAGSFLRLAENARYFAMLSTASADALIACWDAKFHYNFWRPVTAIRSGATDESTETTPQADWIGLAVTPNHPEYPAGHGCVSAAVTETLTEFFGTDEMCFAVDSNVAGLASPVRTYSRFSEALDEVLRARVYGGMHFQNSGRVGAVLGKKVARYTLKELFRKPGTEDDSD
jgi:hypothetical protein